MSRGGRGSFRGGRGGGKQRIGGQEVSWDYDPELVIETKPQEMFPDIDLPRARPATQQEKASIARYRALRKSIHDGPFYTILGDNVRISKSSSKRAAEFNPFEDMPTYTQKYKPASRKLPRFDTRKYQLRFFPEELWDTIDLSRRRKDAGTTTQTTKQAPRPRLDDVEDETEAKTGNEEDEDPTAKPDEEDEASEANPEDDFSEDDSEMGADYNAENYFDAGDDDADAGDGEGLDDPGFD